MVRRSVTADIAATYFTWMSKFGVASSLNKDSDSVDLIATVISIHTGLQFVQFPAVILIRRLLHTFHTFLF